MSDGDGPGPGDAEAAEQSVSLQQLIEKLEYHTHRPGSTCSLRPSLGSQSPRASSRPAATYHSFVASLCRYSSAAQQERAELTATHLPTASVALRLGEPTTTSRIGRAQVRPPPPPPPGTGGDRRGGESGAPSAGKRSSSSARLDRGETRDAPFCTEASDKTPTPDCFVEKRHVRGTKRTLRQMHHRRPRYRPLGLSSERASARG